jgi:predicted nucleic acid-binding protein
MAVLVDTSIWIEYFRTGNNSKKLDFLIDENLLVTLDSHFKLMKGILRLQLTD